MFKDLVKKTRSIRRFDESYVIEKKVLYQLVDLARLTASARNMQPLKYFLSCDDDTNSKIFSALSWAGYLKDWNGPEKGERPSAYIAILGDKSISEFFYLDPGIAVQTIMLGASELGLGGCIIGSFRKKELSESLNLERRYDIQIVAALGKPKEEVIIEEMKDDGDIRYWRDAKNIHHVPKRKLENIIIEQ